MTCNEHEKHPETERSSDNEDSHDVCPKEVPLKRHGALGYLSQDIRSTMFAEFQLVILTFCTGIQGK